VLIALARTERFSVSTRGQVLGIGVAAVGQAVVSAIIAMLVSAGTLDASAIWWEVFPVAYISRRAFVFPELAATDSFMIWLAVIVVGALLGFAVYRTLVGYAERTGRLIPSGFYGLLVLVVIAGIGWAIITAQPGPEEITIAGETLSIAEAREQGLIGFDEEISISTAPVVGSMPVRGRFRFEIGTLISPEYMALLLGLVIYTSAFIGEIVRAGIQAVPYGQIEAARATGLTNAQTLRLVVLPQALRLIIPPLSNQYLNLSKNSSLATAVAFADTYQIGQTMMNQSGQSVTGFTMILVTYLVMSLVISAFMNFVNGRFQLKTR
jgi:general L-amino acid transport system permease protein